MIVEVDHSVEGGSPQSPAVSPPPKDPTRDGTFAMSPFDPHAFRPGDVLECRGLPCLAAGAVVTVVTTSPLDGAPFPAVPCDDSSFHAVDEDNHPDFTLLTRVLSLTAAQLGLLRDAMDIAYADDDAPVYDSPGGLEAVADLRDLLTVADATNTPGGAHPLVVTALGATLAATTWDDFLAYADTFAPDALLNIGACILRGESWAGYGDDPTMPWTVAPAVAA